MSVPVPLEKLRSAIAERGAGAYLLSISNDLTPHAVHVATRWEGDVLVASVGKRSAANCEARANVSLLFPLREPGDYSLIVDGTAGVEVGEGGSTVRITPTRGVLHRAATVVDPASACSADCVPLLRSADPATR